MSGSSKKNLKTIRVAIVDYGIGNLYSLRKACAKFTENAVISEDPDVISSADAIILPGVGAFKAGMEGLKKRNLVKIIKRITASGKPILGICLGAQLMLEKGYEFGEFNGLGLIPGKVVPLPSLKNAKIPQIGWNKLRFYKKSSLFDSLNPKSYVYFVHSYILKPASRSNILAETSYGGYKFCSAIKSGNAYGTQFHPEKSGVVGLKIIENFIKLAL
ncbi:MAG: imidazole glycerol phosphate synthase, glutamine amidotransferase subunit [Candidatus Yanofskybacteria bacterium RIFCSPHIGHO2_02_FULL_41_11]|uniref:Imidazole glycerol phosphate synthase subunit HisH n=1 Tax=Candidatus Yanofskybacteria bacterium RIFCSPHIGHO2_02_FULL_41_11 TaxID=1802675 RepID=A0A1F8FDJ5_9BACT|nr:MAG: imidazole glycerol phosphate synthase, glutamine amidotransferase subunit [Candidatus Yanofskybacteria bacterium RIFCSPHIGHO2_02_FULL_41_11]